MCFGVKITYFVFYGVKKVGIIAFLVSADNSAGVDKMTNIMYEHIKGPLYSPPPIDPSIQIIAPRCYIRL